MKKKKKAGGNASPLLEALKEYRRKWAEEHEDIIRDAEKELKEKKDEA
jgi:cellobiose-specific phosphotransferase system component IIA